MLNNYFKIYVSICFAEKQQKSYLYFKYLNFNDILLLYYSSYPSFLLTTMSDIKNCPPVITYLNGSTLWIKAVNKENVTKTMTHK